MYSNIKLQSLQGIDKTKRCNYRIGGGNRSRVDGGGRGGAVRDVVHAELDTKPRIVVWRNLRVL